MFINAIGHYLPENTIPNEYFKKVNGLSEEWILSRTGITERRRAGLNENTNTMAINAVNNAGKTLPGFSDNIDLIIGATYSPYDTVGTLAHAIQQEFNIDHARVLSVSSACSSFLNALEIADAYFNSNKASKAIVVASEHNTAYHDELDAQAGHLWGDGAAALFLSKEKLNNNDMEVVDISTRGLGNVGKSIHGVVLRPNEEGIKMPFGRDVFINATKYMIQSTREILKKNDLQLEDIRYFITHQANIRIIENVQKQLNVDKNRFIINIDKLGNTGCASTPIALSQKYTQLEKGDNLIITVFGGGYSCASALLKK